MDGDRTQPDGGVSWGDYRVDEAVITPSSSSEERMSAKPPLGGHLCPSHAAECVEMDEKCPVTTRTAVGGTGR